MRKPEFHDELKAAVPEISPVFDRAVRETIAGIARSEQAKKETIAMNPGFKRRTLMIVLAAVLLLAAVATAATLLTRNVFDVTMGDTPTNATALTQYDLAEETIGNARITVKEAAYDGISLYIAYSIRDMAATTPLGTVDETGERWLMEEDYMKLDALGVGWWTDNLWIDGQSVDMPSMSGGDTLPGDENGEALYYMIYRLDQVDLYLDGKSVEIALPIGQRQDRDTLEITRDPFSIAKPKDGLITFQLDCSSRDDVTTESPNILTETPQWSAKVSQVVYSPLQMYVTIDWSINPEAFEAFIAENGDGYYDGDVKLFDYTPMDVGGSDIMSLQLVDGDGKPVFETMNGFYGCGGAGDTQAWYTFPYAEKYPDTMYLAPDTGEGVDMTRAIRLK